MIKWESSYLHSNGFSKGEGRGIKLEYLCTKLLTEFVEEKERIDEVKQRKEIVKIVELKKEIIL